ncbi:MAG: Holliday junction branch migration protein RuvA [Prolixibacteraceae bacterium]|jgi:Holliday junction DNA helicase RuvA|nr:Holliday junction branch migration protein RuvA [Prolixibacteraceae bacterium]MDD4755913.1 Holliday junction branch migration protein RuvA [Prolixibacteraceae bacterium]NLO02464.1 Holliday junction branch migration protein RuvA [Bacteroidales bacterium]
MYEFIRGDIADLKPASVVIETGGVGYFINISLSTYSKINGMKNTRLLIHQVVREDAQILYGFAEKSERDLFRNLISVNGVGAGTAIMMLSSLNADEIRAAVASGNTQVLTSVKGIGSKTAQRIIIDLRDKLSQYTDSSQILLSADNTLQKESLSALVMLGFAKKDAENAVSKIIRENPEASLESVIKQALKRL